MKQGSEGFNFLIINQTVTVALRRQGEAWLRKINSATLSREKKGYCIFLFYFLEVCSS